MATNSSLPKLEHIVVLMLENRSFDHLLGAFPNVDGASNSNYNSVRDLSGQLIKYPQYPTSVYDPPNLDPSFDPDHSFEAMMIQMFGPDATGFWQGKVQPTTTKPFPGANPTWQSGYLTDYYRHTGSLESAQEAMSYFGSPSTDLPVFYELAKNFVVCDKWFCDVPAFTYPNRLFMHSATSEGSLAVGFSPPLLQAKTIYQQIDEYSPLSHDDKWGVYYWPNDENDANYFSYTFPETFSGRASYTVAGDFISQAANGTLPFYSFLMPVLNTSYAPKCNSMHPPADVRYGENYIANVYNALRNSRLWENTLLIITYDENGAIYDHNQPPTTVSPGPNSDSTSPLFDFTTLGVRIPALLISPWLQAGCVDSTQYQNTSILRFVQDLLSSVMPIEPPPELNLTQRDLNANSIASAFDQFGLDTPRTDCPESIAIIPGFPWTTQNNRAEDQSPPSAAQIEHAKSYVARLPGHPDSGKPITREFPTYSDMYSYREERRQAAFAYLGLTPT